MPPITLPICSPYGSHVQRHQDTPKQREPIEGIQYSEVLYADDTLIFGNYTHNINLLLKEIQTESRYYNMELNMDNASISL